jgi:hypothetical protein
MRTPDCKGYILLMMSRVDGRTYTWYRRHSWRKKRDKEEEGGGE